MILTHLPIRLYLHRQQHSLHLCSEEEIYPAHCIIISFSLLAILSRQPDIPHQQGPQTPPSSCTVFQGLFALMYIDLALLTSGKVCLACKYSRYFLFVQEKQSVSRDLFSLQAVLKVSVWIWLCSGCVCVFKKIMFTPSETDFFFPLQYLPYVFIIVVT